MKDLMDRIAEQADQLAKDRVQRNAEIKRLREALRDCKMIAQTEPVDLPPWALPNKIAARVDAALAAQEEER